MYEPPIYFMMENQQAKYYANLMQVSTTLVTLVEPEPWKTEKE